MKRGDDDSEPKPPKIVFYDEVEYVQPTLDHLLQIIHTESFPEFLRPLMLFIASGGPLDKIDVPTEGMGSFLGCCSKVFPCIRINDPSILYTRHRIEPSKFYFNLNEGKRKELKEKIRNIQKKCEKCFLDEIPEYQTFLNEHNKLTQYSADSYFQFCCPRHKIIQQSWCHLLSPKLSLLKDDNEQIESLNRVGENLFSGSTACNLYQSCIEKAIIEYLKINGGKITISIAPKLFSKTNVLKDIYYSIINVQGKTLTLAIDGQRAYPVTKQESRALFLMVLHHLDPELFHGEDPPILSLLEIVPQGQFVGINLDQFLAMEAASATSSKTPPPAQ